MIHNPLVEKIEIVHRAKVRRKNLSFLRERSGKSARLANKAFDRIAVNTLAEVKANAEKAAETVEASVENAAEKVEAAAEKVAADVKAEENKA